MRYANKARLLPALFAMAAFTYGCSDGTAADNGADAPQAAAEHGAEEIVTLSAEQIKISGIQLSQPSIGGAAGSIDVPAIIEGDPQGIQIVSAAVGGRVVSLSRNLGERVRKGDPLAVVESREVAQIRGDIEAAKARSELAQNNFRREQRLFSARVSPEQDLIAARTAAAEAAIALRQARQQLSAAGVSAGALNRLALVSPISGQVIARSVTLGETVAADAALYRIANLSKLSLTLSLSASDAASVRPGATIHITAPGRRGDARVTFVSPVLDEQTRLVAVIASLDNATGEWRVGENVQASVQRSSGENTATIAVPQIAVQTVENKPVVFVRTATGFKAKPVKLGPVSGDRIAIQSGLTGRERIATTNSFILKAELGKGEAEHGGH